MLTHQVLALPIVALAGLMAVFVFGGIVKGVTGVGLPLVLVPLTAQFLDAAGCGGAVECVDGRHQFRPGGGGRSHPRGDPRAVADPA